MTNKKQIGEEHEDEGSRIFKRMKNENPFRVPDDFFEEQRKKINQRIAEQGNEDNHDGHRSRLSIKRLYPLLAAAAVILLLLAIYIIPLEKTEDYISNLSLEQLLEADPDFINYMDEDELLETLFADIDVEAIDDYGYEIQLDSDVNQDDIIEYLLDDNIYDE